MSNTHRGRLNAGRAPTWSAIQRLAGLALTAALTLSTVVTVSASAASATGPSITAIPGLVTVQAVSANNSTGTKSVIAFCPGSTMVVGTGGAISAVFAVPASGRVFIEGIVPLGSAVVVQASEDEDGFAGNWSLTAYAVCANPLPGLQTVTSSTQSNSTDRKIQGVICPTGKQPVGTGAAIISAATGQVRLGAITGGPNPVASGVVSVLAVEDETTFAGNWSAQVHAICANPLPGLELISTVSAANSDFRKVQLASCPAGKRRLGGGFIISSPLPFRTIGLESLLPSPLPGFGPPTGTLAVGTEADNGFGANWTLNAEAICANA